MRDVITILYNEFETLDVFGPIEVLGRLPQYFNPVFYSMDGGIITSSQKVPVMTQALSDLESNSYILFIPGGTGAREQISNDAFIDTLRSKVTNAEFVLTVCTGSILLAKTGILAGRRATSNKRAFAWTKSLPGVNWVQKARWVKDDTIYTSSGVSAGMDMALGFVADLLGYPVAEQVSREMEYVWNKDPEDDPFYELYR